MANVTVTVDEGKALIALGRFRLSLQQNEELMREIGNAQLVSVRRTFREEGSPSGSWVPLAASTIKSDPRIYGAGHKLLVRSGRLLNSIGVDARPGSVTIGTSVAYAGVHQYGSRDRGTAIGPQTKAESGSTVKVAAGSYQRLSAELGTGYIGKQKRRIQGPRNAKTVNRRAFDRHQNIPPRPYLVFRPEDPQRIRAIVVGYVNRAASAAGLGGVQ
jgi:phage gpG-like protein